MLIEYDAAKREKTLRERGLDFGDAQAVLEHAVATVLDRRSEYGEERWNTLGILKGRMVHVTWTRRGERVRVISMRYANERERTRCGQ